MSEQLNRLSPMKVDIPSFFGHEDEHGMKVKNTFLQFDNDVDDDDEVTMNITRSQTWNVMLCSRLPSQASLSVGADQCVGTGLEPFDEEDDDDRLLSFLPRKLPDDAFPDNYRAPIDGADPTTMMLRNFPRRSQQKRLLSYLDSSGLSGQYDFVYLPFCFEKKQNLGYAFINFRTPQKAVQFYMKWHKQSITSDSLNKPRLMNVSVAQIQGREDNLQRIIKECKVGKITNPKFQPVVYDDDGSRVDFSTVSQNQRAQRCQQSRLSRMRDSKKSVLSEGSRQTSAEPLVVHSVQARSAFTPPSHSHSCNSWASTYHSSSVSRLSGGM
eukprot:GEMP01010857.1.p1 GENE.GEMP01010857.1~~GEMP01010857.1.p1  ORF type:complete len:326 (+),score=72.34 GEMP01010857.1:119-1096(+)